MQFQFISIDQFSLLGGIFLYGFIAALSSLIGFYKSYIQKRHYTLTPLLAPYGIFVWGDAFLIGGFWAVASFVSFSLQNTFLFLVLQSLYWIVRAAGEILYWLLQQFAQTKRDLPESLYFHKYFHGESIWFVYQLFWQLVLVLAATCLIFLLRM